MKLKIVNEQEKNLVYLVTDSTEELNLPRLSENQMLLAGKSPSNLKQYRAEDLRTELKENSFHYSIYLGRVNLNGVILEDEATSIIYEQTQDAVERLLDYFNQFNLVKIGESQYDTAISSFINGYFDDLWLLVDNSKLIYLDTIGYTIDECNSIIDKLDKMTDDIIALTGYVSSIYELSSDFIMSNRLNVTSIDDIIIPPLPNISLDLGLDDDRLVKLLDNTKDDILSSRLHSRIMERENLTNILVDKVDALKDMLKMRSFMKISFAPFEPNLSEWLTLDEVYVDGRKMRFTTTIENGKVIHHVMAICSNNYELRLKKAGFLDVVFDMRTKITDDPNGLEEFFIGNINMLAKNQLLKIIFTWGEYPLDLDTHVYSFEDEYDDDMEHAFFLQLKSERSLIDIDIDDVASYGPETTHIFGLDPNRWYLYTIHNYSRYVKRMPENFDMDPEELVNVDVNLYQFNLSIKPTVDLKDKYWWDVLLIHDGKIYVLNSAPEDRTIDYSHMLTFAAKKELIRKASECEEIYEIERFIPTTIRWF